MNSVEDFESITTEEVIKRLGCSRSYLYKKETQAMLGAFKLGNRVKWPVSELIKFKQQNKVVVVPKVVEKKAVSSKKIVSRHKLW